MVEFLKDVVWNFQLRKKFKSFEHQSRENVSPVKTMAVLLPEDLKLEKQVFEALAKSLNISPDNITFVEFTRKKIEERSTDQKRSIYCSRKDVSVGGNFSSEMQLFFNTRIDILINYFSVRETFPELISMNCNAALRLGFSQANFKINDVILDMDPLETNLFLVESTNYLKSFLK